MEMTSKVATRAEASQSAFGAILRETVTEMHSAEGGEHTFEDAVERLALAAHAAIAAQTGGRLPRTGGYAYLKSTVTPPAKAESQLDVRY